MSLTFGMWRKPDRPILTRFSSSFAVGWDVTSLWPPIGSASLLARRLASASQDLAVERNISADLSKLADALDEAGTTESWLSNGPDIGALVRKAMEHAESFKKQWVDPAPLSEGSLAEVRTLLRATVRQVRELAERAAQMSDQGRIDQVTERASSFGVTLIRVSYYNIAPLGDGLSSQIRKIGRRLHLLETVQIYADGGQSMQAIVNAVTESAAELGAISIG